MNVLLVNIHVKPESVAAFQAATLANARQSAREPGVVRFDVLQQSDDPTRFVLYEAYRDAAAVAAHKETDHYQRWAAATAEMFAAPRTRALYTEAFWTP